MHTEPAVSSPAAGMQPGNAGELKLENVHFTYPHTGIQAVKNLSLDIRHGQKVAIVGKTGSGKTTVAQLLIRAYDPDSGSIRCGGVPLQQLSLPWLRNNISYVPQDVFLFSDTVRNNIAFGLDGASDEAVETAARQTCIHDEIRQFSEGYETAIGERGVTLSGGQKQRISIARALIKQSSLVIFDDCLSAVDAKTEKRILQNLEGYLQGRTAIIITHRIFSLLSFDHIIVMDAGAVVEQGTHAALLRHNGHYAALYRQQQEEEKKQAAPAGSSSDEV